MRITKQILLGVLAFASILHLASCEQNITVESVVRTDGSIDRTILFLKADSSIVTQNLFGINEKGGWTVTSELARNTDDKNKYDISFQKYFASIEDVNAEMNAPIDTFFRIRSDFQKRFRWFYTYMNFSDTYIAVNRFSKPSVSDYFTPEDFNFIDRLPPEGSSISKADSLYLAKLNEKIFDEFAARAIYELYFDALIGSMEKNDIQESAVDSLNKHKEHYFQHLVKHEDDFDDDFMLAFADSLGVVLSDPLKDDYKKQTKPIQQLMNFMTSANEGKYTHIIKLPWPVIETNADSVSVNELYWQPPVTKFLLHDYTMYAEARQLNYWAVVVSLLVVGATIFMFLKRRTRT